VKKILNPPADSPGSKTGEEDGTKDTLRAIFSEFRNMLSVDELIEVISKVAVTLQVLSS
jgi:hypothetical protein